MTAVVHRQLRAPCKRCVEPSGAAHFKLAVEMITGVIEDESSAKAASSVEKGKSTPKALDADVSSC